MKKDESSQAAYRSELKFLCSVTELKKIEAAISMVCFLDSHGDSEGNYSIRSLYYDTTDDKCYYECKAGLDYRKKYRIRIYDESTDYIRLECKIGLHGKKRKESEVLSKETFEKIVGNSYAVFKHTGSVLDEFILSQKRGLVPRVVVGYKRTAYVYPAGNVRITFDRDISAIPPEMFLDKACKGIYVLKPSIGVLEVKFDEFLPPLLMDILRGFNLKQSSFSKYVYCVDAMSGMIKLEIGRE